MKIGEEEDFDNGGDICTFAQVFSEILGFGSVTPIANYPLLQPLMSSRKSFYRNVLYVRSNHQVEN